MMQYNTEGEGPEDMTTCMAAGRQRVDTQMGGLLRDLEALFSKVHPRIEGWSICKQDQYCLLLGMKYYGEQ